MRVGNDPYAAANANAMLEAQKAALQAMANGNSASKKSQADSAVFSAQSLSLAGLMSGGSGSDFSFSGTSSTYFSTMNSVSSPTGSDLLKGIEDLLKEFGVDSLDELAGQKDSSWMDALANLLGIKSSDTAEEGDSTDSDKNNEDESEDTNNSNDETENA